MSAKIPRMVRVKFVAKDKMPSRLPKALRQQEKDEEFYQRSRWQLNKCAKGGLW